MTVMTRAQEDVLEDLIRLAGNAETVELAIKELNQSGSNPTVRDVVAWIVEFKKLNVAGATK